MDATSSPLCASWSFRMRCSVMLPSSPAVSERHLAASTAAAPAPLLGAVMVEQLSRGEDAIDDAMQGGALLTWE